MRSKEEYKKLLDETVEYYSADPENRRAYDRVRGICEYESEYGAYCAVGRCMSEAGIYNFGDFEGDFEELLEQAESQEAIFREDKLGFSNNFWKALQSLHDKNGYWDSKGLSKEGERAVEAIHRKIYNGVYDY
jgi:hypothetical protein